MKIDRSHPWGSRYGSINNPSWGARLFAGSLIGFWVLLVLRDVIYLVQNLIERVL